LLSAETRWRTCEEAFAATAGPKRREALATGARQKKSVSRLLSAETRWRTCEEAFAAIAGPKRREALATGARHRKLGAVFYTFLILKKTRRLASHQANRDAKLHLYLIPKNFHYVE
jgi:hypothetical protein